MTKSKTLPRAAALVGGALFLIVLATLDAGRARGDASAGGDRSGSWSWPSPAPHDVVTGFEQPDQVWSLGHRGIDMAVSTAGVVTAPDDGVVHFAGTVVDRGVLSIAHDPGVLSSFEPVTSLVVAGEPVARGQPIATVDEGHCVFGSCLHLGARIDGVYVSPLFLLGELHWSVLLPTRGP